MTNLYGILQVTTHSGGDQIPVVRPFLTLGRAGDNDVILDDPQVSRHHARLAYSEAGYTIADLGSANGTFVNGQPLPPRIPQLVRPGDTIQIGPFALVIQAPQAGVTPPPLPGERVRISSRPQPGLLVQVDGRLHKFPLNKGVLTFGRSKDNDIVVDSPVVSRHHARLEQVGNTFRIVDLGSANGLVYSGQRITEKTLQDGDVLYITDRVALQYRAFIGFVPVVEERVEEEIVERPTQFLDFRAPQLQKDTITIGRDRSNDIVLDHPAVSRFHARIERLGTRYRIRDLKSANGTFVNGERVEKIRWIKEGDEIRIASFKLVFKEDGIEQFDQAGAMRLDALHLQKWVRKDLNLLQDISLSIMPREFVALVGVSGAGKSTLMDALNGFRPATHGVVLINNVNLYRHFDAFRSDMGYVPQEDIIHRELTVYQALDYAAKLRMPADTTPEERHRRIMEVMEALDIAHRKDTPIASLSGGQRKRVSIGVELLTKPGLFFLDEATSGLDPGTEYEMMKLLRKLADEGRIIILITHATKNVMMCDKVIFLAKGGNLAFYGPPEEALEYFDQFRTPEERRIEEMEFDKIYGILDDPQRGTPEQWAERFRKTSQYRKYVVERLRQVKPPKGEVRTTIARQRPGAAVRRVSALRQFLVLSSRNLRIMRQDIRSLVLMLAIAPLIGMLDFITWKRHAFDIQKGDASQAFIILFATALICILVGILSSAREFVKESHIYKRERMVNLKIGPYVMSKVWVGVLVAFYQAAVLFAFLALAVKLPNLGTGMYLKFFFTLFLGTMSGFLIGLFISAVAPNENAAQLLIIVVLVPQILFGGGLLPVDQLPLGVGEVISYATSTRWAFEALVTITEVGKDIADDACWQLPEDEREALTEEEKEERGCACLGANLFKDCYFPGLMSKYDPAVDEPEPQKPPEPTKPSLERPEKPEKPVKPTPPPQDASLEQQKEYQEAMEKYQEEMEKYQEEMDEYEQKMNEYQEAWDKYNEEMDDWKDKVDKWQDKYQDWQEARNGAIKKAEGLISSMYDKYGKTFDVNLYSRWGAQSIIMLVLFGLIFYCQKRKDVV